MNYNIQNIEELKKDVIYQLGLSVDSNGLLYDPIVTNSFNNILLNNGKFISVVEGNKIYKKNMIVYLDLYNIYLVKQLFDRFLCCLSERDDIHYSRFSVFVDKKNNTKCIKLTDSESNTIQSDYFKNESLSYIDLIYKINGDKINLSKFDV